MRLAVLLSIYLVTPACAETPTSFLATFEAAAGVPGNPLRGANFFTSRHGGEWSCASCHTDNPMAGGRHATTGKAIKPLAPRTNAERFTDAAKVDKWFRRNCNDVLGRECYAGEKADVLAFLFNGK